MKNKRESPRRNLSCLKFFILLFLAFYFGAKGQDFVIFTNGTNEYMDAKKYLEKEIERCIKKKIISDYRLTDSGDTLITKFIYNDASPIVLKLTFKFRDESLGRSFCDYEEIVFDSTLADLDYIETFKRERGFRKIAEDKFLSAFPGQSEMEVKYIPGPKKKLVVILKFVNKTKEEYMEWYDSLD